LTLFIALAGIPALWIVKQNHLLDSNQARLLDKDREILDLLAQKEQWQEEQHHYDEILLQLQEENRILAGGIKRVYLTFDDGPSNVTESILDILKSYGIKATFFVVGANPTEYKEEMIRRIVAEGHSLGNHSYSHDYSKIYSSKADFWQDFKKMEDYLYSLTSIRPVLVRFPGGSRGSYSRRSMSVMEGLRKDMDRLGYIYVDWNVLGGDVGSSDPEFFVEQVLQQTSHKNIATILFHDTSSNPEVATALPVIIEKLQEMGYTFAPMNPSEFYTRY